MPERWQSAYSRKFYKLDLDTRLERDHNAASSRLILADGLAWDPVGLQKVALPLTDTEPARLKPNQHDWTTN